MTTTTTTVIIQNTFLSEHFSLEEALRSQTAERNEIDNTPTPEILEVMKKTAIGMEKVRALLSNKFVVISSWYRCPRLNTAVGSASTSQHIKGEAVDFVSPQFGTPLEVAKFIVDNKDLIRYDQIIYEHTWVHISFVASNPRMQALTLMSGNTYAFGIIPQK